MFDKCEINVNHAIIIYIFESDINALTILRYLRF